MNALPAEAASTARTRSWRGRARSWLELVAAAFILAWPAIYNGFPILYPDSMTYLDDGSKVARAIFLHQVSAWYGMRSLIYSLVILPLHWNRTAWVIVALQCFLVAFVLRLVVRALMPAVTTPAFLAIISILSAVSPLPWCASLVLPDILGPLAYLGIFLLAFPPETLSSAERISLYAIIGWGIASHITHFVIAPAVCLLILLLPGRKLAGVAASAFCFVAAVACTLALHAYLYGQPSLSGDRVPFLAARVIADGPGRWYLAQHCGQEKWVACAHLDKLTDDPDILLWSPDGLWESLTDDERDELKAEETPFVKAVVRAYPWAQFKRSAANAWSQLQIFGLDDLDPSSYVADSFNATMPASRAAYLRSRQARDQLPLDQLSEFYFWAFLVSASVAGLLLILLRRRMPRELLLLAIVVLFIVMLNAAITGPLSMPEDRLQSRVAWLVPFLAELCVAEWVLPWLERRRRMVRGRPVKQTAAV